MKYLFLFFGLFFTALNVHADHCAILQNTLLPGQRFELERYDARDRLSGVLSLEVRSNRIESGYQTVAFEQEKLDGKRKLLLKGEYLIRCKDGIMFLDMTQLIPDNAVEGMGNMEFRADNNLLRLPLELTEGQMLPAASLYLELGPESAGSLTNLELNATNRRFHGIETVQTPNGEIAAHKITQTTTTRSRVMMMRKTTTLNETFWYDMTRGLLVKSESTDQRGRKVSSTKVSIFEAEG